MAMFDLIIRNGTIVDGSGGAPFRGDVAIIGSKIVAVGKIAGTGSEEIDASGRYVTPGFVDIHTHYDGQATWENRLAPSSNHGVTTVVGGNCGVGFAPCRSEDRQKLIKLMEGVEDIPEVVMIEGIPWNWESFPEYLDALDQRDFDVDVAMQIAHSPLRVYVMGDRGVNLEPSTDEDRKQMAALVTEAVRAGALGVSTSRSMNHRSRDGHLAPSVNSAEAEVVALAAGLRSANGGVFQLIPEYSTDPAEEMSVIAHLASTSGRPVSFSVMDMTDRPGSWREMLTEVDALNANGLSVRAQIYPRPTGVLMGLELSVHPLMTRPGYKAIAHLPLDERVALLRNADVKARILADEVEPDPHPVMNRLIDAIDTAFALGETPDYLPSPEMRLGLRAAREGRSVLDLAYDVLLEQNGQAILYLPAANFISGNSDAIRAMMDHPNTVIGLGDGGAHYGMICDASYPTFLLSYWCDSVAMDERRSFEWAVNALSRRPAETVGLLDRGLIAPGYKADINIIDRHKLKLYAPRVVRDLPAGGTRLRQQADGYEATIVSGVTTYRRGVATGALPGRLVRGSQETPQPA